MAKIQFKGINEYARAMQRVYVRSSDIIGKAIYEGAAVIADGVKDELKKLPVDESYGSPEKKVDGVTKRQKADLIDGFGISSMRDDKGYLNVKLGFDGYGRTKTKKYPKGVPNQLIARSVNTGTSFRKRNPFMDRAVRAKRKLAEKKMMETMDEDMKKEMK